LDRKKTNRINAREEKKVTRNSPHRHIREGGALNI